MQIKLSTVAFHLTPSIRAEKLLKILDVFRLDTDAAWRAR